MPEVKEFVDFDHEVARKLPHLANKYREAVKARLEELEGPKEAPVAPKPLAFVEVYEGIVEDVVLFPDTKEGQEQAENYREKRVKEEGYASMEEYEDHDDRKHDFTILETKTPEQGQEAKP